MITKGCQPPLIGELLFFINAETREHVCDAFFSIFRNRKKRVPRTQVPALLFEASDSLLQKTEKKSQCSSHLENLQNEFSSFFSTWRKKNSPKWSTERILTWQKGKEDTG
jgi:hypothetical protein